MSGSSLAWAILQLRKTLCQNRKLEKGWGVAQCENPCSIPRNTEEIKEGAQVAGWLQVGGDCASAPLVLGAHKHQPSPLWPSPQEATEAKCFWVLLEALPWGKAEEPMGITMLAQLWRCSLESQRSGG